eukprot:gene1573-12698_t
MIEEIYFETQEEKSSSCFIRAMNNYFQKKYINDEMFQKLKGNMKDFEIQNEKISFSFFGDDKPFESTESDTYDYFEIHSFTTKDMFLENIFKTKCEQLSPNDALFLLEHQLNGNKIVYKQHRFFHRYAKENDPKRFIEILKKNSKINKIYFCRIEKDKSHAFCSVNFNDNWYLLDSLKEKPKKMNSIEELFEIENAGIASIMIVNNL